MESIMMQWPMEFENKVRKCMIEYRKFIVMETVFGIAVYFMLISENLVNSNDGIWHISRSIAGEWETSLGRGLLFYFDKMRCGLVSVPFNTILTLLIISITNAIILDLFKETQGTLGIVLTMIFIANPITCDTLSYCYTSVNYGLAFLFSVIAVKCIAYSNWSISILLGGCFIAVSLGCYQAYFGVTCLLLLMLLLKKILQDIAVKEMVDFILRCICSIITGGIIYYILSYILLNQYGIALASYRGASEVSVSRIIVSLPASVQACYQCFYEFFCKNSMYVISKKALLVLAGIGAIVLIAAVQNFMMVWHKNKIYAMGFIIGICLVPIACNMIILIAVGNGIDVLMAMGMVMNLVLLIAILPSETKSGLFMRKMSIALLFCLLWLNVLTVTNDQLALKEGKTATVGLTESIIDRLIAGGVSGGWSKYSFGWKTVRK